MHRCGLFVLSFVLSVLGSSVLLAVSSANAQTGLNGLVQTSSEIILCDPPQSDTCVNITNDWFDQYLDALERRADSGNAFEQALQEINASLIENNYDWLLYHTGSRVSLVFAEKGTVSLKFSHSSGLGNYMFLDGVVRLAMGFNYESNIAPAYQKYYTEKGIGAGFTSSNRHISNQTNYTLVHENNSANVVFYANTFDVEYPEGYEGSLLPESTLVPPENTYDETVRCDWHDVACWLTKVTDTVVDSLATLWDGVVSLFEGLIEFLASIFIPGDKNILVKAFADLNEYMRNKLGFLLYPVDFLNSVIRPFSSNTLDTVVKDEFHCNLNSHIYSTHCKGVCAPNVLGDQEICLRIGELETRFPQLWTTMIWFLRVSLVVSLIELLRRKYMQIVSN